MAISPVRESYQKRPPGLRAIGSLLVPPNSVARRLLDVCRDAFLDIRAAFDGWGEADAIRDRHLILLIDAICRSAEAVPSASSAASPGVGLLSASHSA